MRNLFRSFVEDDRGEDLIEYGLLAAFVASLAIAVLFEQNGFRDGLAKCYKAARSALELL